MKRGDGAWVGKIRLYADEMFRVDIWTTEPGAWRWHAEGIAQWVMVPDSFTSFYDEQADAAWTLDALQQEAGRWEAFEDFAARVTFAHPAADLHSRLIKISPVTPRASAAS